jgi:glycosyltransferase involved in cell wall biosynthesis
MGPLAPWGIAKRLEHIRPDVLHLHGSRAALFGVLAARRTGMRPILYTAHAFSFNRSLPAPVRWAAVRAETLICSAADRVICLTRGDRDAATARGIPTGRCVVIPNGIDVSRFPAREDRRAELGFAPDAPVVGMLARLVPQKDPLAFARIARRVAAEAKSARFLSSSRRRRT